MRKKIVIKQSDILYLIVLLLSFSNNIFALDRIAHFLTIQTTAPSNPTDINQSTFYPLKWTTSQTDPNYFTHDTNSFAHEIYVSRAGYYFLSLTIPVKVTSDTRQAPLAQVYINGSPISYGLSQPSYTRRADGHDESSINLAMVLPNLSFNDKIEIYIGEGGDNGVVTTTGARLYLEEINSSSFFFAKATETNSSTNLNEATASGVKWVEQIETAGFTHDDSSNPENITINQSGDYMLLFNFPLQRISCSNYRTNTQAEIKINGSTISGGFVSQGYIRCTGSPSHDSSSVHFFTVLKGVTAGEVLSVTLQGETSRLGGSYEVNVPSGKEGSIFISKIDTSTKTISLRGTNLTTGTNWNPSSGGDIQWSSQDTYDSNIYTHSTSSSAEEITVKEDGDYLIYYSHAVTSAVARANTIVQVKVNGSTFQGAECSTSYMRNLDNHNNASCTMNVLLPALKTGDKIKLSASAGAASGTTTLNGNARIVIIKKGNTQYDFDIDNIPNKVMHFDASSFTNILDASNRDANDSSFDGTVAKLKDISESINIHDATQVTVSRMPSFDKINKLLTFDGTDDYFGVANHDDLNLGTFTEKTIVVTFRTGGDVTSNQVIYEQGGTVRGMNVYIGGGNLYIASWNLANDGDGAQPFTYASTPISINTNYHALVVWDYSNYTGPTGPLGELRGYINGVEFDTLGTTTSRLFNHPGAIGLGAKNSATYYHTGPSSGTGDYFEGDIFELIIYNKAIGDQTASDFYEYLKNKWPDPYPVINFQLESQFTSSPSVTPSMSWTASITTDINYYEIALGITQGATNYLTWTSVGNVVLADLSGLSLSECTDYYATIRAVDSSAENSTVKNSDWFRYDGTVPSDPSGLMVSDIASTTTSKKLSWTVSTDTCGFSHYEMAIGTSSGGNDTVDWINIGNVSNYQFTGIAPALIVTTDYYTSIRAVDLAGNISAVVTSSSWQVDGCVATDVTAPTDPSNLLLSGVAGPTVSPNLVWDTSTDACGFSHYELAIGTTSGNNDVVTWTNAGDILTYKFFSIAPSLSSNQDYFMSVKAVDLAENESSVISSVVWQLPSPGGVSSTGLELWLDVSDTGTLFQNTACSTSVTTDGQNIGCWQDKSGNGNNVTTGSNYPRYETNEFNSGPIIRFDGSDDRLSFNSAITNIRTLFIVNKSSGTSWQQLLGHSTLTHFYSTDTTLLGSTASSFLRFGSWKVNRNEINDPENYAQTGGYSLYSVVTTGNVAADHISSDRLTVGRFFGGDVVEVIIYSRVLSGSEVTDVENYLHDKYFSTNPLPVTNVTASPMYTTDQSSSPEVSWDHSLSGYIDHYEVALGLTAGSNDLAGWLDNGLVNKRTFLGLNLTECQDFFASIKVIDQDSLESSVVSSSAMRFDETPPTPPTALNISGVAAPTNSKILSWSSSSEDCSFSHYEVALGTTTGGIDIIGWTNVGITNSHQFIGIAPNLNSGTDYYISVRAFDSAGNNSFVAYSAAWQVDSCTLTDVTDPTDPSTLIMSGKATLDESKTLSWSASTDGCSFSHYEIALGTSSGGNETITWINIGNVLTYKFSNISPDLSYGTDYYISVRAHDSSGNISNIVSSSSFEIEGPGAVDTTGLSLWLDVQNSETLFQDDACLVAISANNQNVGCVKDLSGNDRDATVSLGSAKPLYRSTSFKGYPSLYFDGLSDEYLDFSQLTNIRTVFWVIREDNSNPGTRPFLLGDPNGSTYDYHGGVSTILDNVNAAATVTGGTMRLNSNIINGATTARPTAESVLSIITTGNTTASAFSRDRTSCCGNRTWGGYLAELIIYNRALDASEVGDVEEYLKLKWGIQATSTTWTGSTNTDWNTASNWSDGVPDSSLSCVIDNKANDPIISSGTATCKTLEMSTGILNIGTGNGVNLEVWGDIDVSGILDVNDNTLTIRDDGTGNGAEINASGQSLGNLVIDKTNGAKVEVIGNGFNAESISIRTGKNFTLELTANTTVSLTGGVSQASANFKIKGGSTLAIGNGQGISVTGGVFAIEGTADLYPQDKNSKGQIVVVGGSGEWSFSVSGGSVSLEGFILDRLDEDGLNISGTANLSKLDGGQFTNLKKDYVTPVKAIQLNTTTAITESIASGVGFTFSDFNDDSYSDPVESDNYYIVYAPDCGNGTLYFDDWFGSFYSGLQTFDTEAKIYDTDDGGPTCQVSIDLAATPVVLSRFEALPYNTKVLLEWETTNESEHIGFNVYRSDNAVDGYVQINNDLIRNFNNSSHFLGDYRFVDSNLTNGDTYFYMIEDVATNGDRVMHGPVIAVPDAPYGAVPAPDVDDNYVSDPAMVEDLGNGAIILSRTEHTIRLKINPSNLIVNDSNWNSDYEKVDIAGYTKLMEVNYPELLVRRILIPISENFTSISSNQINFTTIDKTADLTDPIVPAPDWVLDGSDQLVASWTFDGGVYSIDAHSPSTHYQVSSTAKKVGSNYFVEVLVWPLRYNSLSNNLIMLSELILDIGLNAIMWDYTEPAEVDEEAPAFTEGNLRIRFDSAGVYKLTYDAMATANVEIPYMGKVVDNFRIYYHGEEIPIFINSSTGNFASGDEIIFNAPYEKLYDDKYDEVVLTLFDYNKFDDGDENSDPYRFKEIDNQPSNYQADTLENYRRKITYEENNAYYLIMPIGGSEVDRFYWASTFTLSGAAPDSNSRLDTIIVLNNLDQNADTEVQITIYLFGRPIYELNPTHSVALYINGVLAGTEIFKSQKPTLISFTLSPTEFNIGNNNIRLEVLGNQVQSGDYDYVYFDKIEVEYPSKLVMDNGIIKINNLSSDIQLNIAGLITNTDFYIFDTSKFVDGMKYQNYVIDTFDGGTTYDISFDTVIGEYGGNAENIVVVEDSSLQSPDQLKLSKGYLSRLKNTTNQADLLLIGNYNLLVAAGNYIVHRESQGIEVMPIEFEQIYTEFSHGRVSAQAIKDFIMYAYNNWDNRPEYILILGDATFDPQNIMGDTTLVDLIPIRLIEGPFIDFGSTSWFVTPEIDEAEPEVINQLMAIGWIPSSSPSKVMDYLNKVMDYENGVKSPTGSMAKHSVMISGEDLVHENFAEKAYQLANTLTDAQPDYSVSFIDKTTLGASNVLTQAAIVTAFASGPLVVSYMGHGADTVWDDNNMWNNDDATALINNNLPIIMAMNCSNSYFYDSITDSESLSEAMIFNPSGGAIAFMSSTTMSAPTSQQNLSISFYSRLVAHTVSGPKTVRLGNLMLEAKASQGTDLMSQNTIKSYTLIGDPSLKLPLSAFSAAPRPPSSSGGGGGCTIISPVNISDIPWYIGLLEIMVLYGIYWLLKITPLSKMRVRNKL